MPRELVIHWAPIPGTPQEGFFDDDTPGGTILFTGGWGSGKTSSLMAKVLKLSAINAPLPGIWCVPDYEHIHDTILRTLSDSDSETETPWFLRPDQYSYTDKHKLLEWEGGGPILFKTAENHKSIAGPNVAWCATDEPGSIKREAWRNATARVRHPAAKLRQKVAAGTPEGLNYLADLFGPDRDPSYHVYRMDTRDNPYLPDDYLADITANSTEAELQAYLEGKFVNLTGSLAYPEFSPERQMRELVLDPKLPLRLSFDFNVNPMATTIGQQWPGPYGPEFGVYHALALPDSTVMASCAKIRTLFPTWPAGIVVYGDASGKSRNTTSTKSNYAIIRDLLSPMGPYAEKWPLSNPPVALRINSVNVLCKNANDVTRLWLHGDPQKPKSSPCRELIRSLQQTTKKTGTDDLSKPSGETVTHMSDALGYWLTAEAPAQRPSAAVATIATPRPSGPSVSGTVAAMRAAKSAQLAAQIAKAAGRV